MLARVGIFDSGVGGLSVAAALHRSCPALPIVYIADTAYFPYGLRSEQEVSDRAMVLTARLVEEGANAIVAACNTASSAALERLRVTFDLPIVGVEPPLKPAVERSTSGRVAVLATPGTVQGARLARLAERHASEARVFALPMPGLADLVESGEIEGDRVETMLRQALDEPVREGIDAVALGCTHYGFLVPLLQRLLPPGIAVIETAEPVARRTIHVLREAGYDVDGGEPVGEVLCYATGDPDAFEATIARLRAAGAALPPLRVVRPVG